VFFIVTVVILQLKLNVIFFASQSGYGLVITNLLSYFFDCLGVL